MSSMRIKEHPILGKLNESEKYTFTFNDMEFEAWEGDTIASALLANQQRVLRLHEDSQNAKGIYCNIGHCLECRVKVNGQQTVRACITLVEPNMKIESI